MTETDYARADIGIVSALPLELAAFLSRCDRVRKYTGGNFTFRGGRLDSVRIVVVETGECSFARTRRATESLIEAHSPDWILSCGFSGALRDDQNIGDIVVANAILDTHGNRVDVPVNLESQPGLHVGPTVVTDELTRTVAAKRALTEQWEAVAVDMDSLAVAQVCRDVKRRFMSIRTISDDLSIDLPPEILSVRGRTGSMRFGAALGALWKRPASAKEMWTFREQAATAADRLAAFLEGVVFQLIPQK